MTPAVLLPPAERAAFALRLARECRGVASRSWGSSCVWCGQWIASNVERAWIPMVGAACVDCLAVAVDEADAAIRQAREARQ